MTGLFSRVHVLRTAVTVLLACSAIPATPSDAVAACTPISTMQQLSDIRKKLDGNFCLTKNLDAKTFKNFQPIGDPLHPLTEPFRGMFDGRGFAISNLTINTKITEAALFMRVGKKGPKNGVVKNLRLLNISVNATTPSSLVGSVAGVIVDTGIVTNVSSTGIVRGKSGAAIGGLIGRKEGGTLSKCFSTAKVSGPDNNLIGGAIGEQWKGLTFECYATGTVTTGDGSNAGGFVGHNLNDAVIRASYATGAVTGRDGVRAAGFTGLNDGLLEQVYALGAVRGGAFVKSVGSLVGNGTAESRIKQAYGVGKLTVGMFPTIGGLMGFSPKKLDGKDLIIVTAGYWNTTTTGRTTSSGGGQGRTTAQLKAALPAGFAAAIWTIKPGVTYPFLKKLPANPK